jgi:hypothetical protein
MPSLAEIAKIKAEIAKLESELQSCTDTKIQELVEIRIAELKEKLARLQSSRRGPQ